MGSRDNARAYPHFGYIAVLARQFSVTVSLRSNIDSESLKASQIRSMFLRDDLEGAANIWWQWRRTGPVRHILAGLVKRRKMEKEMFLSVPTYTS